VGGGGMSQVMTHIDETPTHAATETGVPVGYKLTEVGVIPGDWVVKKIAEIGDVKGGKRLPKGASLVNMPNSHPYIRVADMFEGGVHLDGTMYVPEDIAPAIKNYRIYSSDIFISVAGTLGVVGKIPPELDGANLTENADRITNISCDRDLLLYWLMSEQIQSIIDSVKTIGAQPKLALGRIENFIIALPPSREEQRAIAAALSDVDALIASQEAQIAKQRAIKTATMQQLLSGKQRLPGFTVRTGYQRTDIGDIPEDWVAKRLGEVCKITTGKKDVNEGNPNGVYPFFTCSRTHTFSDFYSFDTEAILIAGNGDVGTLHYYKGKFEAYQRTYVVSRFSISPSYIFHYLERYLIPSLIVDKIGSSIPYIKLGNLLELSIPFPQNIDELNAITTVLYDIDAHITALEAERDKTEAIKQGMMQQLLTGRIRL
jgi:type I restriction enzyme, S subunit